MMPCLPSLRAMAALFGLGLSMVAGRCGEEDYLRDVKPILTRSCVPCHGATQQKGGLRLDTAAAALQGGDAGPALQPGKSSASLLIQTVKGVHEDIARMPYKKPPLPGAEIELLARWINEGAPAPKDEVPGSAIHWSFIAPGHPREPRVKHAQWARNGVDSFILARLEKEQIQPAPEADRVTLIRRVSLDLTGLPPTPADVNAFVRDGSPDAYEALVERLLASPHFGERWGRHWLDVARYADSNGYSIDAPRSIWKYRDWVVQALNRDLPFDQFVTWQLAGDLLPSPTIEQRVATGFHRNTQINQEGGIDPEQFRIESIIDRVNTTGTALLGLTIGCAQCHDHKFDPLAQKEYYQLFAFFNNADEPTLEIPDERLVPDNIESEINDANEELDRHVRTVNVGQGEWEKGLSAEALEKLGPEFRAALALPQAKRSNLQQRLVFAQFRPDDKEFKRKLSRLQSLEKREAKPVSTLVMQERKEPRRSYLFIKGDFTRDGGAVTPGVPATLHAFPPVEKPSRLDLARWIVAPENPLTARVTVNRMWQEYFGRGLVETENDFGTQGELPSHPELLDWLATEFMARHWSMKEMHRLIVTSATYRQSSRARPDLEIKDPRNKLLARQSRLRLDAELVRDVALASTGLLNPRLGGPPVYPPQPDGVMSLGQVKRDWKASEGASRYRRGLYTFFFRATPHPALAVFDAPDGFSACTRRLRSNTPLQALTLLNNRAFYEFASALADRVLREGPRDDRGRIEYAMRLCLARPPAPAEVARLKQLLDEELAEAPVPLAKPSTGAKAAPSSRQAQQLAAWTSLARVLLNLDETITRE